MTDASSKIAVRRLQVGDLLIQIFKTFVHYQVYYSLFSVGRNQRPINPAS